MEDLNWEIGMSTLIAAINNLLFATYTKLLLVFGDQRLLNHIVDFHQRVNNSYLLLDLWLQMSAVQAYEISLEKDLCTKQIKPTIDLIIIK